jgi:hypothetical protein
VDWTRGLRETVEWFTTRDLKSYWKNFESALLPHPRFRADEDEEDAREPM